VPSKNFIPAFHAHVGNWEYYLCLMSYAQVAREISFAYEMGGNKDLTTMIQRGIGARTSDITDYLLTNDHRFLGSLVVAAWGGAPEYLPLRMDDEAEQSYLAGVDREFGVLTFDGTQQFFALDGQHRLKAIKDAIKQKPELGSEDIGVIVVPHFDTSDGRQQTRRLFTNINRNAVKTSAQENIALDEDDGFAILTRRFLTEHPFLSKNGVVQVFSRKNDEGELRLATRQVSVSQSAWTTIGVLYDVIKELGFDLDGSMHVLSQRATDDVLDESYERLSARIDELFEACGDFKKRYLAAAAPRDLRAPKGHEGDGHPFMRPVVQIAVSRAVHQVIEQGLVDWKGALSRLSALDWRMVSGPFLSVWQETGGPGGKGKMINGKDFTSLLFELLVVHIAPSTKAQIDRAIKSYRSLKNLKYFMTVDELAMNVVPPSAMVAKPVPALVPTPVVDEDLIGDVEPDVDVDAPDDEEE
jgi:DNA sulfur modification protein DndB